MIPLCEFRILQVIIESIFLWKPDKVNLKGKDNDDLKEGNYGLQHKHMYLLPYAPISLHRCAHWSEPAGR